MRYSLCSVLLQMGFTQPASHPAAGELLPHHFALTRRTRSLRSPGGMFLWHFPWGRPHWTLSSILLCGVRTFLEPYGSRLPVLLKPTSLRVPYLGKTVQFISSLTCPMKTRYN